MSRLLLACTAWRRLIKQGSRENFNHNSQETIDRGVFKALTKEEADSYTGPINYIIMTGSTNPIRIYMNSSMKQPGTGLMKGPLSLADLYAVTLGFREQVCSCQGLV
jgi:hypothetical protein